MEIKISDLCEFMWVKPRNEKNSQFIFKTIYCEIEKSAKV